MISKDELKDGTDYLVTFNNGTDQVIASWIEEYQVFSYIAGSVSYDDAEKIEKIE